MSDHNSFIKATEPVDERLEALKQLYPEIFSDGKINLDAFKDVTNTSDLPEGQDKTPGYYGLYWPGKRAAKQLARKEPEGTLEPVPGDGVDEDTTHNIYIEGDNLEVLRILKQSYKGRVKMIYIDPPYNTGNDFIYPDDYKMPVEEYLKMTGQMDESGKALVTNMKSNGAFHSNWLNMMYPRLQVARELLTEDGVIFISIDDNEQSNLKLLCDDVFGEENFIAQINWKGRGGRQDSKYYAAVHEYILCYAKKIDNFVAGEEIKTGDIYPKYDEQQKRFYKTQLLRKWGSNSKREDRPNLFYPIKAPDGTDLYPIVREADSQRPSNLVKFDGRWRWAPATMTQAIKDGRVEFQKTKDGDWIAYEKIFAPKEGEEKTKKYTTWIEDINDGANVIKTLFPTAVFDYPKSPSLIGRFLKMSNVEDTDIVLDFFSGSATTAHATIQLNSENNSSCKFVMVQLPHSCDDNSEAAKAGYKNICEIGKERIRRAGKKILEENKDKEDLFTGDTKLDIGFKVFRLNKSNFVKYTPVEGQDKSAQDLLFAELENQVTPLVSGWKPENVLTEIILRQGFALDYSKEKLSDFTKNTVYKIKDAPDAVSKKITLYVCLDNNIAEETIKTLSLGDDEKFICLDSAIDDTSYARLCDKGRIETI